MNIIFTDEFIEMLKVEKVLIKELKFRWSHLQTKMLLLKTKFKDDIHLKNQGGICILLKPKDKTITWSYGKTSKRGADKSKDTTVINTKEFLQNPHKYI